MRGGWCGEDSIWLLLLQNWEDKKKKQKTKTRGPLTRTKNKSPQPWQWGICGAVHVSSELQLIKPEEKIEQKQGTSALSQMGSG